MAGRLGGPTQGCILCGFLSFPISLPCSLGSLPKETTCAQGFICLGPFLGESPGINRWIQKGRWKSDPLVGASGAESFFYQMA